MRCWHDLRVVESQSLDAQLVRHVAGYSARVRGGVLEQHERDVVFSPLGIWLLLCVCLPAVEGSECAQLESIVGCSREAAGALVDAFLSDVPAAVQAAVAVWVDEAVLTGPFVRWREQLPARVDCGGVPSQADGDGWADRSTLGLIPSFPMSLDGLDLVLVSAIATIVSWRTPYEVASAGDWFSASSPWAQVLKRVLVRGGSDLDLRTAGIVETHAAGLVAVHDAVAQEDLTVICVCADPTADRWDVVAAGHEIATHIATGSELESVSLFDLPVGDGHSWVIDEREVPAPRPGDRHEAIASVALPAWEIHSGLDLLSSPAFGVATATDALEQMIGGRNSAGRQFATATFDRYGFRAAAIDIMIGAYEPAPPPHTGLQRTASLRFDHPFAVIAVIGRPSRPDAKQVPIRFSGLPIFEAWVHTPTEASAPYEDWLESLPETEQLLTEYLEGQGLTPAE